jgi:carbon-monoxide dehydrogenase large subunit
MIDPADLRERNLIPPDTFPLTIELGEGNWPLAHDSGDYPAIWRRLLDDAGYAGLREEQRRRRAAGEVIGVGLSCFTEGVGFGPFEDARVVAEPDGAFTAYVGVASVGQGVRTGLSKILADALGVSLERVMVSHQDTDTVETGGGAFASRTIVVGGNAILVAVADLEHQARVAAALEFGVPEEEIEVSGGVARAGGREVSLGELGCEGRGRFEKPSSTISCGGNVALVAVDPETGKVVVERFILAYDIGRAIDPALVHGQLVGAAAQGIGGALLEELVYDENGQPMSTSFVDYLLPTIAELPEIEAIVIEGGATNPLGVKGAGEGGIVGTLAAVGNAVADALGDPSVVKTLPLTPNAVRALIRNRS